MGELVSESEHEVVATNPWLCGALAGLLSCFPSPIPAKADAATPPVVPTFSAPDAPLDKPDLAGRGPVRFVTTNDYPPFGFRMPNGTPAGFDVDLARALCQELGLSCTIQARKWDEIVPVIMGGEADAAVASLAITDEARRSLWFTAPYYRSPARFITRLPGFPIADPSDLEGKRVAVEARSAQAAYLATFFPQAIRVPYDRREAVQAALKTGTVDAAFGDAATWTSWLGGEVAAGCCGFAGGPYTESRFFGAGAGIAVRKGDTVLRRALDAALSRIAAKGVYGDIYLRYFPLGLY